MAYAKRFRIPLIGITRRAHSSLAEQSGRGADPAAAGSLPLGLAPTTSTTLLALGDALAVALLEWRGFRRLKVFHPGGLGRQLLRVTEMMHTGAELRWRRSIKVSEAILVMTAKRSAASG